MSVHLVDVNSGDADADRTQMVCLSEEVAGVSAVPSWDVLARSQQPLSEEVLKSATAGQFFALEDRNIMSEAWRPVFVVHDGESDSFVVFDRRGYLIEEPSEGLKDGRQSVKDLVEEYSDAGFYYRPPKLRPSPSKRSGQKSITNVSEPHPLTLLPDSTIQESAIQAEEVVNNEQAGTSTAAATCSGECGRSEAGEDASSPADMAETSLSTTANAQPSTTSPAQELCAQEESAAEGDASSQVDVADMSLSTTASAQPSITGQEDEPSSESKGASIETRVQLPRRRSTDVNVLSS